MIDSGIETFQREKNRKTCFQNQNIFRNSSKIFDVSTTANFIFEINKSAFILKFQSNSFRINMHNVSFRNIRKMGVVFPQRIFKTLECLPFEMAILMNFD